MTERKSKPPCPVPYTSLSYHLRQVRCGRKSCRKCSSGIGHNFYWYGYWREGKKVRSYYFGRELPTEAKKIYLRKLNHKID